MDEHASTDASDRYSNQQISQHPTPSPPPKKHRRLKPGDRITIDNGGRTIIVLATRNGRWEAIVEPGSDVAVTFEREQGEHQQGQQVDAAIRKISDAIEAAAGEVEGFEEFPDSQK